MDDGSGLGLQHGNSTHHSFFLEHGRKPYTPVNIMAGVVMPSVDAQDKRSSLTGSER